MTASDLVIAGCYVAIAVGLLLLARQRGAPWLWIGALSLAHQAAPSPWLWRGFGCFILACGLGHLVDVVAVWIPTYRAVVVMRTVTAVASVATAAVFCAAVARIRRPPTPDTLAAEMARRPHVTPVDQVTAVTLDGIARILKRVPG